MFRSASDGLSIVSAAFTFRAQSLNWQASEEDEDEDEEMLDDLVDDEEDMPSL